MPGEEKADMRAQRRALLLFHGGRRLREIFAGLPDTGNRDDFDKAKAALTEEFVGSITSNPTVQRHAFKKITQKHGETVSQFVGRLKLAAVDCQFKDADDQIRDQCVSYCISNELRRKFLEKEGLELKQVLEIAAHFESVERRLQELSLVDDHRPTGVNKVRTHPGSQPFQPTHNTNVPSKQFEKKGECYRCGKSGHYSSDKSCPALGKVCSACGGKNHFAKVCRSKGGQSKGPSGEKDKMLGMSGQVLNQMQSQLLCQIGMRFT